MAGKRDELRRALDRPQRRGAPPPPVSPVGPVEQVSVREEPAPTLAAARPAGTSAKARGKVRMTVDILPTEFEDFRDWRNEHAAQIGQRRINASQVMVTLLRRLLRDETLQGEILAEVERDMR